MKMWEFRFATACCVGMVAVFAVGGAEIVSAETVKKVEPYSQEAFLDAAYSNCSEKQNRESRVCKCERHFIAGDRLTDDDKKMAYSYWVDRENYVTMFEAKKKADPKWLAGFSERFNNMQAYILSMCGG